MTTKPVRLLPCPFCGSEAEYQGWHGGAPTKVMVSCSDETCAVGPEVTGETLADGAARWNARAGDPAMLAILRLYDSLRSDGFLPPEDDPRMREWQAALAKAEGRS